MWDKITYPFPNVNDKLFHQTHYSGFNYLSMLGLKLIHVSEKSYMCYDLHIATSSILTDTSKYWRHHPDWRWSHYFLSRFGGGHESIVHLLLSKYSLLMRGVNIESHAKFSFERTSFIHAWVILLASFCTLWSVWVTTGKLLWRQIQILPWCHSGHQSSMVRLAAMV